MKTYAKPMLLAIALTLATGLAHADGDGGDNSMSQWTGESYAAFNGNNVGDFGSGSSLARQKDEQPAAGDVNIAGAPADPHYRSPFRDDTAA